MARFSKAATLELGRDSMRPQWPLPPEDELRLHIEEYHRDLADERLEGYKFVWQEFGPPADMLLVGGISGALALQEMRLCFIDGHFLACVLLAQTFVENSLGGSYILSGDETVAEKGFAKLIDKALDDKHIDSPLAEKLHELRLMRNPYVHPKAGSGKGTLMRRILGKSRSGKEYESLTDFAKEDAQRAIRIVVDFLRDSSRRAGHPWEPPTPQE